MSILRRGQSKNSMKEQSDGIDWNLEVVVSNSSPCSLAIVTLIFCLKLYCKNIHGAGKVLRLCVSLSHYALRKQQSTAITWSMFFYPHCNWRFPITNTKMTDRIPRKYRNNDLTRTKHFDQKWFANMEWLLIAVWTDWQLLTSFTLMTSLYNVHKAFWVKQGIELEFSLKMKFYSSLLLK